MIFSVPIAARTVTIKSISLSKSAWVGRQRQQDDKYKKSVSDKKRSDKKLSDKKLGDIELNHASVAGF